MAALMLSTPAHAQSSKPLFKYGKWLMAAGALSLNYLASRDHDRADDRFHLLEQRCLGDARLCDLAPTGRYADATSETLYQESVHYDRRARRLLFGGEAALLGSAAIFVWELTRHSPKPDNIPFEPELRALNSATGVGLRVRF
jgi:hypothetical protein